MKNARFWVFVNSGYVKLTIPPGVTLSHSMGGQTGEGAHWEATRWEYEDGVVTEEWDEWGSDCDGRYERYVSRSCPVTELTWDVSMSDGVPDRPNWIVRDHTQRDHTAEAAGY